MPPGSEESPSATRRRAVLRAAPRGRPTEERVPPRAPLSPAEPLPPHQPDATDGREYPVAEVAAAVAASCLLTALLVSAGAVLVFSANPPLARRFGDEQRQALIFVGLASAIAVFLVTFATAWLAAALVATRRSPFDFLGLSLGILVSSAMLILAVSLALLVAQSDRVISGLAAVGGQVARAQTDAVANALPRGDSLAPQYPTAMQTREAIAPIGAAHLGALVWATGRALVRWVSFGGASVVSTLTAGIAARHTPVAPAWTVSAGLGALPLAVLELLAAFGVLDAWVILLPMTATCIWLGWAVVALLGRAERSLGDRTQAAPG